MTVAAEIVAQDPDQLIIHNKHDLRLGGSRCTVCARTFFPRRWECAVDQASCEDIELSPTGTLYVSTYVRKPSYGKQQLEDSGYGVGQIDLPEGPRIQSVLLGDPSGWVPGATVELVTEPIGIDPEGRTIVTYRFRIPSAAKDGESPDDIAFRVGYLAAQARRQWPDRVFTIFGDEELTFGQLADWVDVIAADLVDRGTVRGDRVLVHLPNGYEVLLFQLAAWRIGAVAVPVVPIYRQHELAYIIGEVRPRVIITTTNLPGRTPHAEFDAILAETSVPDVIKYLVGDSVESWLQPPTRPAGPAQPMVLPEPAGPDEDVLILFTSGTTAAPKGALLTSRAIVEATGNWRRIGASEATVALAVAPLAHIAGLIPGGLMPLVVGCRVVIATRWVPDDAVVMIDKYRVTLSCGAAVFLQDLIDRYRNAPPELHRLSFFISGGAATPPELIRNAAAVGMQAGRAYGMTETAGVITTASPDDPIDRRAEFDGKIASNVEVAIVDAAGDQVPAGHEGAIRIRGAQVMSGYTDPVVTAQQMHDGWFEPGDVGLVSEDGWLRMTGRTKDIINRGGEKFSSSDIEGAILSHPDVARVAVKSVPHERFGETVGAWIVLERDVAWTGPTDLIRHLDEMGLAKAKYPAVWTVLPELPMTVSGKMQKHLLTVPIPEQEHRNA